MIKSNYEQNEKVLEVVYNNIEGAIYVAFQSCHLYNLDDENSNYEVLCVTNDKSKLVTLKTKNNITINKIGLKEFKKLLSKKDNAKFITPIYSTLSVGELPLECFGYDIKLKDYKLLVESYYKYLINDNTKFENYDTIKLYKLVRLKLLLSDLAYGDKEINEVWFSNENNIEYLIKIRNHRFKNFKEVAEFNYNMALDYYNRALKTLR